MNHKKNCREYCDCWERGYAEALNEYRKAVEGVFHDDQDDMPFVPEAS